MSADGGRTVLDAGADHRRSPDFSLFRGDLVWTVFAKAGFADDHGPFAVRSFVAAVAVCWVPPALLSMVAPAAPDVTSGFFQDLAAYVHFFLALPIFIALERHIDDEQRLAIGHFMVGGFFDSEGTSTLRRVLDRWERVATGRAIDALALLYGYVFTLVWIIGELRNQTSTWHTRPGASGEEVVSAAGWWVVLVSVPLLNTWVCRWIMKGCLWCRIVWEIKSLNPEVEAEHPDGAGGLAFMGRTQSAFGWLAFAFSSVVVATMNYKLVVERETIASPSIWLMLLALVVAAPAAFALPLIMFSPALTNAKRFALLTYSTLGREAAAEFQDVIREIPSSAERLKAARETLDQLAAGYRRVGSMRTLPLDVNSAFRFFWKALAPPVTFAVSLSPYLSQIRDALLGRPGG